MRPVICQQSLSTTQIPFYQQRCTLADFLKIKPSWKRLIGRGYLALG
jgi:hypothetical protein